MSVNIGIYLNAYDKASATLSATGKGVESLGKKTKAVGDEVAKTGKKFLSFNKILEVSAGMILRDVINKFSQAAIEALELGGQVKTLQASFDALSTEAGATDLSLEGLREATKGTVSDVDLLTAANNALALGLPVDELDDLFKSAMDVGHAMGRTTLQAVQDLTTGIGRGSARILDNLGILVDTNQAYEMYAETLGKTSSELTEGEKKTAFMTAAIKALNEKSQVLEGTTSESQLSQEKWNASITNAKTSVGGFLGPLGQLAPMLKGVMPLIGTMATKLLGDLITKQNLATVSTHALTIATKLFNLILKANPLILIASAVALIIAAFVDWGAVITFVQGLIEGLFGWLRDVANFFGNLFSGIRKTLTGGGQRPPSAPRMIEEPLEDTVPTVIPAQRGLNALIKRPTLILAGEKGPERLSITPGAGARGREFISRGPNHVQMVFNEPIVYVEGSADVGVAEDAAILVQRNLQNVILEASSPSAPSEHKRIRLGTTMISPSTVKSSASTGGSTVFTRRSSGGGGKLFKI